MTDILLVIFIVVMLGIYAMLFWPQKRVTEEDIKKIEAMGRAGVYRADRMSTDERRSDYISRPPKSNGFEQHKKVVDNHKNTL